MDLLRGLRATSFLELRAAWRSLAASKAVTITAAGMLALGIGLNTAVSAVAYSVLLRPLPYRDVSRLVVIAPRDMRGSEDGSFSLAESRLWRERLRTVDGAAAWASEEFTVRGAGDPVTLRGALVDGPFFATLGSRAVAGQPIDGDASAVVVGPGIVQRLGGPDAVGQFLRMGQGTYRVSATMPPAFAFPSDRTAFWLPVEGIPGIEVFGRRDNRRFVLVARMRPGVSVADVETDAKNILGELDSQFADPGRGRAAVVRRLDERLFAPVRPALRVFVAGGLILLIIACANAATLLVGRAVARDREIAVRLALGASQWRLLRGFLVESAMLAALGAAAGIGLALVVVRSFAASPMPFVPRAAEAHIEWPVLLWSIATAGLATLVCGVLPALQAIRRDRASAFRRTGVAGTRSARRLRGALVIVQMTLATVLLVSAALLIRTVAGLARTDTGIEPTHALAVKLMLTESMRFDAEARGPLLGALLERVRRLPGVSSAGAGSNLPPRESQLMLGIRLVGGGMPDVRLMASLVSVTPGYLEALGARVIAGRGLTDRDLSGSARVAVISASTARAIFAGRDAVGQELPFTIPGTKIRPRVLGVVGDVRYEGLETASTAAIYVPWTDLPTGVTYLIARTDGDPASLGASLAGALREVDPGLPIPAAQPLSAEIAAALAERHMRAVLGGGFAAAALLVALAGLSGTLARLVVERRREIAIRAALGATPQRATRLVIVEGAALAGAGLAVGLGASAAAGRGLSQLLYGVTPYDPSTYAAIAAGLFVVALAACYAPARRAAHIEPLELLRAE